MKNTKNNLTKVPKRTSKKTEAQGVKKQSALSEINSAFSSMRKGIFLF